MRNVTAAYHTANKSDMRSSDFLIFTDFNFGVAVGAVGWERKTVTGNAFARGMYRYPEKTSKDKSDYGYISFSRYDDVIDDDFTPGITIFFEDAFPTKYEIHYYTSEPTWDSDTNSFAAARISPVLSNDKKCLKISKEDIFMYSGYKYTNLYNIEVYVREWSKQNVQPVILFTTYDEPPALFESCNLLNVNITFETDPTAQSIPYNSYSFTAIDESDAYNPLVKDSKIYNFTSNQKFRFYNFEAAVEQVTDNLSLFDCEICPVGTAYFRNAIQQGSTINFDFMDIVEKYDNIHLSNEELELSSHFIKHNVKEYLTVLFGDDLDTELIPKDLEAITPFYTESKIKILLYMAQLMQKYIYVTNAGILSFRERSDWTEDFCIELAQSYQNPTIEKSYENNGVEINVYSYSLSQNVELVTGRVEFIFDGEVKFYYDGTAYRDTETDEKIDDMSEDSLSFIFPRYDFKNLTMRYKYNDVYERDTVFGTFFNVSTYMAELKNYLHENIVDADTAINFIYCDVYVDFSISLKNAVIATDSNGETTEAYKELINLLLIPMLMLNELQGCKIMSSVNTVKRKKYNSDTLGSAITIDNPAIADLDTAKAVRNWIYEQIEHSAYSIDTDWRGDCSLELGDEATMEIAIIQNGIKDYESRYIGTVVKNIIEYNGALKMQTTLCLPVQKRWNDTALCDTSIEVSASLKV